MSAQDMNVATEASRFEVETSYRLLTPKGDPPAEGWPLVVCLHGQGMDAGQFAMILNDMLVPEAAWLFPQAVYPHEIRKDGAIRIGHAWYLYDGNEEPFRSTLARSESYLLDLIDSKCAAGPFRRNRVFLLGFSQGAYLAYFVAIRNPDRFAALVGIGGRVKTEFLAEHMNAARGLSILMVHGEKDRVISIERAQESRSSLLNQGLNVEFKSFPVGHQIRAVQVDAVRDWLSPRFRP